MKDRIQYLVVLLLLTMNLDLIGGTFIRNVEDRYRNVPQIIASRGYVPETHEVITSDGYILTIHRIINPLRRHRGKPVVLMHGLLDSSATWVLQGSGGDLGDGSVLPEVSNMLGFELSRRGYDVWMPNVRGNTYSTKHVTLKSDSREFWQWSVDEMFLIDTPLYIDYVLNSTGHKKLAWIGHSQGGQLPLALMSRIPRYNNLIKPFIGLAPVTYTGNATSRLFRLLSYPFVRMVLLKLGGPLLDTNELQKQGTLACLPFPLVCAAAQWSIFGYNLPHLDLSRIHVYYAHVPAGTSSWAYAQDTQWMYTGRTNMLDFLDGQVNRQYYGTSDPPDYDFSRITNKYLAIYQSDDDTFADSQDMERFKRTIKVKLIDQYVVTSPNFTHLDFIWGNDVGELVYTRAIRLLQRFI